MDYASIIINAVRNLEVNNLHFRREFYNRARGFLRNHISSRHPPFSSSQILAHQNLLEHSIRSVENDIRAGIDIGEENYYPQGLEAIRLRLFPVTAPQKIITSYDQKKREKISEALSNLDRDHGQRRTPLRRLLIIFALILDCIYEITGASRIAVLWVTLEPALLVGAILFGYWASGIRYVYNMPVATFAILGAVAWGLIRMTSTRVAGTMLSKRQLLNLPPVTAVDIGFAEAVVALIINTCVLLITITAAWVLNIGSLPDNLYGVSLVWLGLWLSGTAFGFVIYYCALKWPYARRTVPVVFRPIGILSGVFFVSEQVPSEYRHIILWNPLLHGFQLLRSVFFAGYSSLDASQVYFCTFVLVLIIIGISLERRVRSSVEPR